MARFLRGQGARETRLVLLRPMNGVGKRDDYRAVRLSLLSDGWASEAGGYKECKYTPSKANRISVHPAHGGRLDDEP